jgi:hypothetical protein
MQFMDKAETPAPADLREAEFEKIRGLYADGLVQQIWLRDDAGGACMIVEAASTDEVAEKLNALPLVPAGYLPRSCRPDREARAMKAVVLKGFGGPDATLPRAARSLAGRVSDPKPGICPDMEETTMTIRQTTLAAAFALAAIGPAHAEGLKPLQDRVIDLGDLSGVAYYTVERDGFRVVATLAKQDEDAVPVRVVAVLGPRPKPDALHPARGGHPGRRGRDHQAGRYGACPQGGRSDHGRDGHELTMVA